MTAPSLTPAERLITHIWRASTTAAEMVEHYAAWNIAVESLMDLTHEAYAAGDQVAAILYSEAAYLAIGVRSPGAGVEPTNPTPWTPVDHDGELDFVTVVDAQGHHVADLVAVHGRSIEETRRIAGVVACAEEMRALLVDMIPYATAGIGLHPPRLTLSRSNDARAVFGDLPTSTFYEWIDKGLMTPGVALGARSVAWPSHELEAIAAARIAGKSDDEISDLVKQILAARAKAIGLPRDRWPQDNVVLRAERLLARAARTG